MQASLTFIEGHTALPWIAHLLLICKQSERDFLPWLSVLSLEGGSLVAFKLVLSYGYGDLWTTLALTFLNTSFCFIVIMFRICYWCQQLIADLLIYIMLLHLHLLSQLNEFTQYVRSILCQSVQTYRLTGFIRTAVHLCNSGCSKSNRDSQTLQSNSQLIWSSFTSFFYCTYRMQVYTASLFLSFLLRKPLVFFS